MITLVVSPEELQQVEITVHGRAYGHLFRSRRLGLGAEVRLVDGSGSARFSQVIENKLSVNQIFKPSYSKIS